MDEKGRNIDIGVATNPFNDFTSIMGVWGYDSSLIDKEKEVLKTILDRGPCQYKEYEIYII